MWGTGILVCFPSQGCFSLYVNVSVCMLCFTRNDESDLLKIQGHVDNGAQVKEKSFPYAFRQKNFLKRQ